MVGTVHHCRSPLTNHIVKHVPGECRSGKVFAAHAGEANDAHEEEQATLQSASVEPSGRSPLHTGVPVFMPVSLRCRPIRRLILFALAITSACAPQVRSPRDAPRSEGRSVFRRNAELLDPKAAYRQAGLIVQGPPLPFVGAVRYFAGRTPDSTLLLLSLSLANRSLTFTAEGKGQRALYAVLLELKQGDSTVVRTQTRDTIRVGSFKETTRPDESVVFQHFLSVPPGSYTLSIVVRDESGTNASAQDVRITVPQFHEQTLSSPVAIYEATPRTDLDSLPHLIANPRATVTFGRDSLAPVYLEGYDLPAGRYVAVSIFDDERHLVLRDTVLMLRHGALSSAVLNFPVADIGVGRLSMAASIGGAPDTVVTPLLVSFGEEIGIMSFDELLSYLRYYAAPQRLDALRRPTGERRAEAWATFWKETDPVPATPEHEGLREYFTRIQTANERFNEEGGPGWLTDRGKVYITLGEPDQVLDQSGPGVSARGRVQVWDYTKHHVQLVFVDQTGFGRWRLTPASESDFEQLAQRERIQ